MREGNEDNKPHFKHAASGCRWRESEERVMLMHGQSEGLSQLEAYIQAVGLASTCVGSMVIDTNDPIAMMREVCNLVTGQQRRIEQLEAALDRYAYHSSECKRYGQVRVTTPADCTCDLDKARKGEA